MHHNILFNTIPSIRSLNHDFFKFDLIRSQNVIRMLNESLMNAGLMNVGLMNASEKQKPFLNKKIFIYIFNHNYSHDTLIFSTNSTR